MIFVVLDRNGVFLRVAFLEVILVVSGLYFSELYFSELYFSDLEDDSFSYIFFWLSIYAFSLASASSNLRLCNGGQAITVRGWLQGALRAMDAGYGRRGKAVGKAVGERREVIP